MKNYYILDYNKSFINDSLDLSKQYNNIWTTIKIKPSSYITTEGLLFILKTGMLPFSDINLFIGSTASSTNIHIDNLEQSYAINYVWGDSSSKMRWFELCPDAVPESSITTAGTNYMAYDEKQVKLIEEIEVPNNTLFLVRTDIPHQVINYSSQQRYCISVRGKPVLSWENAVKHFSPYFKITGSE